MVTLGLVLCTLEDPNPLPHPNPNPNPNPHPDQVLCTLEEGGAANRGANATSAWIASRL